MSDQPRAFLPPGALTNERVRSALSDVLDAWSSACFTGVRAAVSCADKSRHPVAEDPIGTTGDRAVLSLSGPGQRRMLELALGESLEGKALGDADRQLLDSFADRLAADLVARLDALLEADAGPLMRLELALDGRRIGGLSVSHQAIVALVRKALPAKTGTRERPRSRTDAVARLPVTVEAILGRLELTLGDAKGLAVGDVLVLDQALGENAAIRIAGGHAVVAAGRLAPDGGHNTIIIAAAGKGLN